MTLHDTKHDPVQLGEHVGYSVLFEDMTKPGTTFIKFATDNVLLREMMEDNNLERYSTIILDEVQERTVDTDILMSLLKEIAKHRSDLKIVVMSSTRDAGAKFQKFFSRGSELKATLFEVSGRTHSVKVFYTQVPEPDYLEAAVRTVLMIHRQEEPGDILLFLTGEEEIEVACRIIKREADEIINEDPDSVGPLVCIPLHSSLSPGELERIFNPPHVQLRDSAPSGRKIIVATSIAETSFAIDGIVYVVDPGFSKQSIYQPRIGFESLLVSPISKASARQRAGRAGRTRPGKCFRLYTERDFIQELEEENYPEILKCNLGSTVLELLNIGVKVSLTVPFLDDFRE
jgi:pre-mRNA-splicing factor ATP-dependent RNA helicase DHX15/PRP43